MSMTQPRSQQSAVLCVGLVCLDIISYCDRYPQEDEDMRVNRQKWSKGGNAANTATVLKILTTTNDDGTGRTGTGTGTSAATGTNATVTGTGTGIERVEFMGTIGTGVETEYVLNQLDVQGVSHDHCAVHDGYRVPTSCVILNTTTGTRTIVHYRNLPDLCHEDFMKLNLSTYKWIHFEGKNTTEVTKMIETIRTHNKDLVSQGLPPITISIELEKKRDELKSLQSLADVLFISKEYAMYRGYQSPEEACLKIREYCRKNVIIVCAWGERGATATDTTGQVVSSPSFPPSGGVVDTLGAGDTFNGAVIYSLSRGSSVRDAILFGCRVAGAKCGIDGFDGLKGINWDQSV